MYVYTYQNPLSFTLPFLLEVIVPVVHSKTLVENKDYCIAVLLPKEKTYTHTCVCVFVYFPNPMRSLG